MRLIVLCVIRFFRRLHAFSRFSLSAAVSDWTLWRRNTLSFKFFAILTTEEREMPVCLAISRGLLPVPGCPSWLQINSSTNLMFESVLTERRRPLPRSLSALPDESILRTRSYSVRRFHCLAVLCGFFSGPRGIYIFGSVESRLSLHLLQYYRKAYWNPTTAVRGSAHDVTSPTTAALFNCCFFIHTAVRTASRLSVIN